MTVFWRAPGETGGGNAGVEQGQEQPTDAKVQEGGDAEAKSGEKATGSSKDETNWQEKFETISKERDELAKSLGKQSKHIGTLKKFYEMMEKRPEELLRTIAKQSGINLRLGDDSKPVDVKAAFEKGDIESQVAALHSKSEQEKASILAEMRAMVEPIKEHIVSQRYEDFDNLQEDRHELRLQIASGMLSQDELLHLAARGRNVETAIAEAKKLAIEEYKEELTKKGKEQLEPGKGKGGKPTADDAALKLENVVGQLKGF